MATITNSTLNGAFDNITYCGKEATEIWSQQLAVLPLLEQRAVNIMLNVKGKEKVYTGEVATYFRQYQCLFGNTTEASLAENYIVPEKIDLGFEFCMDEFRNTFLNEGILQSVNRSTTVPVFSDWFLNKVLEGARIGYEKLFWQGDTASANVKLNAVDGIEKKLAADANVIQITGSTITTQNVIAQVEAAVMQAIDAAATAEVSLDTHKVFMNKNDVKYLEIALGNRLYQDLNSEGLQFKNWGKSGNYFTVYGFQVMPTEQSRSSIIVAPEKCLTLGTDVFDAHTTIKIVDMMDTNLDDVVRGRIITNLGTAILFPELIAYSHV